MKNDFLILGHGGSGTSLLRGLLNAHSRVKCGFELWGDWQDEAAKCKGFVWGNKQPLERIWSCTWKKWRHKDIVGLIDDFKIIWIVRRYGKWQKNQNIAKAQSNWRKGRKIYWGMRERRPGHIIEVSFEDLLLRPAPELRRVCAFLHIRYERGMLRDGLNDTGHGSYNYGQIMLDRV